MNGTESKYLLTGLAQCGACGGDMFVQSRQHGNPRAHHRGKVVWGNNHPLPMDRTNGEVLGAFRDDLLHPASSIGHSRSCKRG